tara:strand:- start:35652 stop:38300 length:2649 start_codon:yes stop_codon:yes gene_type:complete
MNMWHSFASEKVLMQLKTNQTHGLSEGEVKKRLKMYGSNVLPEQAKEGVIARIIRHTKSPLALVLVAAGIATVVLYEFLDTIVILIALMINIAVGMFQEGKAARIFDNLEKSQEKHTTVLREGSQRVIPAKNVVPGDIVVLHGGASIPADIRLLDAKDLQVNESSLTGEWLPVEKIATPLGRSLSVTEQKNMVWLGTLITQGSGVGVAVATGSRARFGQIAQKTQESVAETTPLQKSIRHIGRFVMWVVLVALLVILALGVYRGEEFSEMLILAIAVAVAAVPAGLPAAVTVVLALGMESVLRKGGLVKNLLAAETLGSTTVVLTDKTGTLTQGEMSVQGLYTAQGLKHNTEEAVDDNKELLKMAVLSSDAFIEEDSEGMVVQGRPIEKAIVEAGMTAGLVQTDLFVNGYERIDFVQFEPTRRYAVSLHNCLREGNRAYISGSPEFILEQSGTYFLEGREHTMTDEVIQMFSKTQESISSEGMRFTAVAYVQTTEETIPEAVLAPEYQGTFTFVGLIAFADAVREDVVEAMMQTQTAGARVIMATGDYPETARAIAYETGIDMRDDAPVLTGAQIAKMNDAELLTALYEHAIIARVVPEQKLRVARLLRNNGEVVAMTGDGVNDAPALAAADIGVAVGSGTEVAQAAADLILVDNSFSVITAAIAEGRRVIANLRKIITYLLSTSFSEIIVIGGALAAGAPLPLLPTQILWANIVEEGFMSFPFAFEPQEKDVMKRKPERRGVRSILTREVRWFIFTVSAITGLFLLGLYFFLLNVGVPIEEIRTVMFVALSVDSMFFAFSFKDFTRPVWKIPLFSNAYLVIALSASMALLFVALSFGPLQKLLSLTPLTLWEIGILIGLGILNLVIVEGAKIILQRHVLNE